MLFYKFHIFAKIVEVKNIKHRENRNFGHYSPSACISYKLKLIQLRLSIAIAHSAYAQYKPKLVIASQMMAKGKKLQNFNILSLNINIVN